MRTSAKFVLRHVKVFKRQIQTISKMDGRILMKRRCQIIYLSMIILTLLLTQTISAEQSRSRDVAKVMVNDYQTTLKAMTHEHAISAIHSTNLMRENVTIRFWMKSKLGRSLLAEKIAGKGQLITYKVDEVKEYQNGTRLVFRGWYRNNSLITADPTISINATSDVDYDAYYDVQYLLSIRAPDEARMQDEIWVDSGASYEVYAPPIIPLSNDTRLVFIGWEGYECIDSPCNITSISKPISLEARYRLEWLAKIHAVGYDGEPVDGVSLILRCGDDYRMLSSDSTIWIHEGDWLIENATWRGFDVSLEQSIHVERNAREVSVPIRVFKAGFRVTDYLGFPAKDAEVTVSLANGTILYEGRTADNGEVWNIGPLPPCDLIVRVKYLWFSCNKTFNIGKSSPITVMVPISLTTIYISAGIVLLFTTLMVFVGYRRKKEMLKQEYREYYETAPRYPPSPPPVVEEEETEEHVVVSVEDVLREIQDEELKKLLEKKERRG